MDELATIGINGNQHMLGFKPLSQDLYETIEPYMGHDFARWVQNKVEELEYELELKHL